MEMIIKYIIILELLIFLTWIITTFIKDIIDNMRYFGNFRHYMWCKKDIDKVIERKYEEHRRGADNERN